MNGSVQERVIKIVAKELEMEESDVSLDSSFLDDLGADSLSTVELVMSFEDEFGIEIPDEEAEKITTVGSAVDYIQSHMGEEVK